MSDYRYQPALYTGTKTAAKLNEGCYWSDKQAGFWRKRIMKDEEGLPFPAISKAEGFDKKAFLKQYDRIVGKAKTVHYKGTSPHRWIKDEPNSSSEHKYKDWVWPEGYRTYLEEGVLPSREFYNFIMGKDLETLPSYLRPKVKEKAAKKKSAKVEKKPAKSEDAAAKKSKKEFDADVTEIGHIALTDSTMVKTNVNTKDGESKIDLRVWYKTQKMEDFAPSPKGFSVDLKQALKLRKMLDKAIDSLKSS